ncbi:unnamed protein product [Sphenostylis stenocarpa]|uniref:Uncharacterized protein n=1 Tax=Sphenostylis stenocarpa TaxID=92480 RepID=A0AA86T186_9FABA|nr:unnamed protein product [Sphenostylis stenocarpa]
MAISKSVQWAGKPTFKICASVITPPPLKLDTNGEGKTDAADKQNKRREDQSNTVEKQTMHYRHSTTRL